MRSENRLVGTVLLLGVVISLSFMAGREVTIMNGVVDCPKPYCPKPNVVTRCPPDNISIEKKCPEPQVYTNCPECDKGWFKGMLDAMAKNHNYEIGSYDCSQFAKELTRRLRDKGVDAESEVVEVNCTALGWSCDGMSLHRVVEIDNFYIESVNGAVIDPQNYEAYGVK